MPLPSPEQPLDVGEFEFDVGGAAVAALAGVRDGFHLAQEGVHLMGSGGPLSNTSPEPP